LYSSGLEQGQVAGFCEHYSEALGLVRDEQFDEALNNCRHLVKNWLHRRSYHFAGTESWEKY
jgi:hypothetical protein